MSARRGFPRFLLLVLAALGACDRGGTPTAAAGAKVSGTDIQVPVGIPIGLDGNLVPAEWSEAAVVPLDAHGARLFLQQQHGTLLLAYEPGCAWPAQGRLVLFFTPDAPGAGMGTPGAVRLDFEPREHNRPHLLVTRTETNGEATVDGKAIARARTEGSRAGVEIAVELGLLGITKEAPARRRMAVLVARGPGDAATTWPEGLDLLAQAGHLPRELADSSRWGRLTGWVDPDGPGAFSSTDWEAWHKADLELQRRGADAHGVALVVDEESSWPKKDGEMVPQVLDNFRWIAAREPLTATDLVAEATVLQFLNRREEVLALLDGLTMDPSSHASETLYLRRARALESLQRYDEAAAAWDAAAAAANGANRGSHEARAKQARARGVEWEKERAAREEDEARGDLPLVLLRTSRGDVLLALAAHDVPTSVKHFLGLVGRTSADGKRTYDGTYFHRVIGDQLAQGGDPESRAKGCAEGGHGDPVASSPLEKDERHGFWRGAVGFARGTSRENGNQFFVLTAPRPSLGEQGYTCFGWVVSGMDVVDRLEQCDLLLEARVVAPGR